MARQDIVIRTGAMVFALIALGLAGCAGAQGPDSTRPASEETAMGETAAGSNASQSGSDRPLTQAEHKEADALVAANTAFGFRLFSALAKADKNIFLSPASVAQALMMVYNGAGGQTQQAMARALNLGGMSLAQVNDANAALRRALTHPDPKVQLDI